MLDRGFSDSIDLIFDGFTIRVVIFFEKGQKQHLVSEDNASRLVTKLRWAVEFANGRLKR